MLSLSLLALVPSGRRSAMVALEVWLTSLPSAAALITLWKAR